MTRIKVDDSGKCRCTVEGELAEIAIMCQNNSLHRCCSMEQDMIWFAGPAGLIHIKDITSHVAQKGRYICMDVLIREDLKIT